MKRLSVICAVALLAAFACANIARAEDKAENTMIARIRILVEHVIAGVKRCRIVHDVFRNTTAHFDDLVMEIACGLHNFRATLRYAV